MAGALVSRLSPADRGDQIARGFRQVGLHGAGVGCAAAKAQAGNCQGCDGATENPV